MGSGKHEWAQLPQETDIQYRMFLRYLESPVRSKVKRIIAQEFGLSQSTVYKISSLNKWKRRAQAYDRSMAQQAAAQVSGSMTEGQVRDMLLQAFERALLRLISLIDSMDALRLLEFCKFTRGLINELSGDREIETAHQRLLEMLKELNLIDTLQKQVSKKQS